MSDVEACSIKAVDAPLEANVESSDDDGSEDEMSLDGFDVLTIDRGVEEGAIPQHQQRVIPDLPSNCVVTKLARQLSDDTVHGRCHIIKLYWNLFLFQSSNFDAELTKRFESLQKRYEGMTSWRVLRNRPQFMLNSWVVRRASSPWWWENGPLVDDGEQVQEYVVCVYT